jgi:spore germination protein PE
MLRVSIVEGIQIGQVYDSSVVLVGDSGRIETTFFAFAVKREIPRYFGNEGDFARYPFYRIPIPSLPPSPEVAVHVEHEQVAIRVQHMKINSVSFSSVVQIGSNALIMTEDREKKFRQLLPRPT